MEKELIIKTNLGDEVVKEIINRNFNEMCIKIEREVKDGDTSRV